MYITGQRERLQPTKIGRGLIPNREAVNWEEITIVIPSQQEFQTLSLMSWAKGHQ